MFALRTWLIVGLCLTGAGPASAADTPAAAPTEVQVSYFRQIRPIFQAHCQGCHQPAKPSGDYVMTSLARLREGGESGSAAIVAGQPDDSYLVELITPEDGRAQMPQGRPALADAEVALVRQWVLQGANDDTPASAAVGYDTAHPPVYQRLPVISSLDYSPDGTLLAVAGFHEVILLQADGGARVARLIGLAERIESVRFAPDGNRLAVAGGRPGRMGELQIWNVAEASLQLSLPITFDTVYGGSWSSDGTLIACGGADHAVRAIEAATGKQVVYMAAHEDWIRGTLFSSDGKSVFSASRDMTVKMTDVATQRFVGNVTTHTPGILRGGMLAIARHPQRDELLVGSADGAPKLFQMDVKAAPADGGNPNQIREYAPLPGRVFDVRFSPDGTLVFAASSLDGRGHVRCYETDTGTVRWSYEVEQGGIYTIACRPDGQTVATAGADGQIRLFDAATGSLQKTFTPVELESGASHDAPWLAGADREPQPATAATPGDSIQPTSLHVVPAAIQIDKPTDYVQLLVTATLPDGSHVDATRSVTWQVTDEVGHVSSDGRFTPARAGSGRLIAQWADQQVEIPVQCALPVDYEPDFVRDVNPILSRLGCNQGTCHGAAKGKNGFKLSLRGYDALLDVRALTDDLASRRVNTASPDDSLMLLKATSAVPHEGGQLIQSDSPYYRILRRWIANGAPLELSTPRVTGIEVQPQNPVVQHSGDMQQVRVIATYADGSSRDVTREAFVESGNTEVASVSRQGVMTALRRGEAPALARYEGAYAATTLTVMGDRQGFVWQPPETWGQIDELVAAKWQKMQILPSELCTDVEFLRRVSLDLTGLPPTAEQVRALLADSRPSRVKREELIDRLVGSDDYLEHWTNKWADLLQVNRKFLGPEGAAALRGWIRDELTAQTPYDQFARKLLTSVGSNREQPAASYYKILRDPLLTMENTTHLWLAIRFNCNKCHDHPFERWTQDQYYQTAAYFAQFQLSPDPAAGDQTIGGSAVEGAVALFEIVGDKTEGEVVHDRTQSVAAPQLPFECRFEQPASATRRQEFAAWITSPDNPYFARSYVNRLWGYLLGVGIIEPLDDIRAGNPPTNPELLDYLTNEFVRSGFNVQHMMRLICRSRTYQLSLATNPWNEDDQINYSHALARRLPAEVLYDAIYRVTGTVSQIPGVPPGTRAAALPDVGITLPDGFLTNLGRPARESACECERSSGLQLGPVMALVSGPTVDHAISDPHNDLAKLAGSDNSDRQLSEELFLRILSRPATDDEIEAVLAVLQTLPAEHQQLVDELQRYEQELAPDLARRQQAREQSIAKATEDLHAYEQQMASHEAELDRQQAEQIAAAQQALADLEQQLSARMAAWEQQASQMVAWTPLQAVQLAATNGAALTPRADGAVVASGPNGAGSYTFVAKLDAGPITGLRLELLSDDSLPSKGPGRAPNGNFVLTEFRAAWSPAEQPDQPTQLVLQNAQADFSQDNFTVQMAIDGQTEDPNNGWATAPRTGENRTAVFQTRDNIGAGPGLLTCTLDQRYGDGQHTIGCFRIAVTQAPRPITLDGLPQPIRDILANTPAQRSDAQQAELVAFFRSHDGEFQQRERALAEAKQPRPVDPQLQQRRDQLALVSQPLPIDPKLARLRRDVELSTMQLGQSRLTFTQDLAWALINSPAFLFNR